MNWVSVSCRPSLDIGSGKALDAFQWCGWLETSIFNIWVTRGEHVSWMEFHQSASALGHKGVYEGASTSKTAPIFRISCTFRTIFSL